MCFSICHDYCFYFMSLKGKSVQELPLHLFSVLEKRRYGKTNEFLVQARFQKGKLGEALCYPFFTPLN